MSATILIATRDGIHAVGSNEPGSPSGVDTVALAVDSGGVWAIGDRSTIWHHPFSGEGEVVARIDGANCLLPTDGGVWIGAAEAALHVIRNGEVEQVDTFDSVPGRDRWFTPWGGPPDVRSLAAGRDGTLFANVHVGGVVRSTDGGRSWTDTMDIHADVHEVTAHPSMPTAAYVASAIGIGYTSDSASSWRFHTEGLHAEYCRAVAVSTDHVFFSASTGSRGSRAALYRIGHDVAGAAERCRNGLPEWFSTNLDTFCLAARERLVVAADADGTVYVSEDEGESFDIAAGGLPPVRAAAIVDWP